VTDLFLATARAASDYYIDGYSARDGVPYWDSGAPNLWRLGGAYLNKPARHVQLPTSQWTARPPQLPAQGLLRLGRWLTASGETAAGKK